MARAPTPKQIRTDVDCRGARPKFDKGAWRAAKLSDVTGGGRRHLLDVRNAATSPPKPCDMVQVWFEIASGRGSRQYRKSVVWAPGVGSSVPGISSPTDPPRPGQLRLVARRLAAFFDGPPKVRRIERTAAANRQPCFPSGRGK